MCIRDSTTTVQIPDDERPRYAIKTLDVAEEAQTPCACFVVPRGREHEFVFSSDEGLAQVAGSAKCARLLVVNLDPQRAGHSFGDVRAVQRELEPLIKDLAPPGAGTVPVMTAGNDLGRRDVVATGVMDSGDAYVVEQVLDGSRTLRRLLFRSNPRSIQTEVAISKVKPPKSKNSKKKGKAKTQWRVDGADGWLELAPPMAWSNGFKGAALRDRRGNDLEERTILEAARREAARARFLEEPVVCGRGLRRAHRHRPGLLRHCRQLCLWRRGLLLRGG